MRKKEYLEQKKKKINTNGHKKLSLYIDEVLRRDGFQEDVEKMRKKYSIPSNGFSKVYRENFSYPTDWGVGSYDENWNDYVEDIGKISKKYEIHSSDTQFSLEYFILYNETDFFFELNGLFMVNDLKADYDCPVIRECNIIEENNAIYPIGLQISPYATKRDLLNYIEKMYSYEILPLQKKYKRKEVKIGKVKKKNSFKQERDDFIYKNKHLPLKEISSLLHKKYKNIDEDLPCEGHISKIISIQKNKRS